MNSRIRIPRTYTTTGRLKAGTIIQQDTTTGRLKVGQLISAPNIPELDGKVITTISPGMLDTVVLIAGVGPQGSVHNQAQHLYTGRWFSLARQYAEMSGHRWGILSSCHGLCMPTTYVKSYSIQLQTKNEAARMQWAETVHRQFKMWKPRPSYVRILANYTMREFLVNLLVGSGLGVEIPMHNLDAQQQLAWLKRQLNQKKTD